MRRRIRTHEAGRARLQTADPRDPGARRVRARDGLQRNVRSRGGRRPQSDLLPRAPGDLRRARDRADDPRPALGLPAAQVVRPDAGARVVHPARSGARRRAADQRCAPLDHVRAGRLPAVGAGQARARDLGRGVSLTPQGAAHPQGAMAATRRDDLCVRTVARPRARPRHDDRARADARRDPRRRGDAGARARSGARDRAGARLRGHLDEPYSRARFFAFLHPTHDAAGTGYQIVRRRSAWAPVAGSAWGSARASRRSSTCPKRTPT